MFDENPTIFRCHQSKSRPIRKNGGMQCHVTIWKQIGEVWVIKPYILELSVYLLSENTTQNFLKMAIAPPQSFLVK